MQIQRILQTVDTQNLVIQVPASFVNRQVEILVITLDESASTPAQRRRVPPQQLAGRVTEKGDVMSSVPAEEWGIH
ncbi:MAG: hypothetical protein HOO93_13530 [Methyloglobulus sp.]|nr:hypothetical protein [Methyloglobulus sp.]